MPAPAPSACTELPVACIIIATKSEVMHARRHRAVGSLRPRAAIRPRFIRRLFTSWALPSLTSLKRQSGKDSDDRKSGDSAAGIV